MLTLTKNNPKSFVVLACGIVLAGILFCGCKSTQDSSGASGVAPTTQPAFALFGPPPNKTGVQLWSENCSRCHNMRPPAEFSPAQWATVVHHMRLRANLTGDEQRKITEFLQASS
jgi:hypothetical protein